MKSRITVTETAYHQVEGKQPVSIQSLFDRECVTDEQWCSRPLTVGKDWQAVELYWLRDALGMVQIANDEGRFFQVIPTEEELAEAMSKVIEVAFDRRSETPHLRVRPKESSRFEPAVSSNLWIRCPNGPAHCTVTLFPA